MNLLVAVVAIAPAVLLFLDAANVMRVDVGILRWIVSGCAALLFVAARRYTPLLLLILCGILFLFNPLFPIHFNYVNFKVLEIVAIIGFAAAGLLLF
jgi:hypothetical protein